MPLTKKGAKIKRAMTDKYGPEKGKQVFYASEKKGTISGVHNPHPPEEADEKAAELLGKPVGRPRGKDAELELSPERLEEIQKAADELWGEGAARITGKEAKKKKKKSKPGNPHGPKAGHPLMGTRPARHRNKPDM